MMNNYDTAGGMFYCPDSAELKSCDLHHVSSWSDNAVLFFILLLSILSFSWRNSDKNGLAHEQNGINDYSVTDMDTIATGYGGLRERMTHARWQRRNNKE